MYPTKEKSRCTLITLGARAPLLQGEAFEHLKAPGGEGTKLAMFKLG